VSYASVLKRARRAYHRFAAEWLVEVTQSSGRVGEYTGLIAEHYFLAGEQAFAADWLTRAGERALLQGALHEACAFFDRALVLLPETEGERRWQALKGRGAALSMLSKHEGLKENIDELLELAQELKDDSHLAEALYRQGNYSSTHSDDREAVQFFQAALIPARQAADQVIESKTLAVMAISQVRLGERQAAQAAFEAAIAIALTTGDLKAIAQVYNNAAVTCTELGDLSRAVEYLNKSFYYYEQVGDIPGMGNALSNLGYDYVRLGKIDQAPGVLERSMKINQEIGSRRETAYSGLNLGLARIRAQQPAAALDILGQAIPELAGMGDEFGQAAGLTYQALAFEADARPKEAAFFFSQAMEIHRRIGIQGYAADAQAGLSRCLLANGRIVEALEHAGQVWRYIGEHGAAGMEFPSLAYLTCCQVFLANGEGERSRQALLAGYEQLMERAEKISDPDWRTTFLENAPEHRQLQALWKAGRR